MFLDYEAHGWKLCAIEAGKKAPVYVGWNVSPMPAESIDALGNGAGLLHALSGTCALDVDNMEQARPWLAERGVDLDALLAEPSSVQISSGRAGRTKLLYKLKKPLRTFKPTGSGLELRCATAGGASVQDVLPPTIHPVTKKPYVWKYGDELVGDWRSPPNIPAALYQLWREFEGDAIVGAPVESGEQTTPLETVRKAILQYVKSRKKDVNSYDDWIEIGMRLHKETSGTAEGLDIWDEWSQAGKTYKGLGDLKTHWFSFTPHGPGGQAVGMTKLIAELPAEPDEFPIEPTTPVVDEETTAALVEKTKTEKRKAAREWLEGRLIYVADEERYFDTERHKLWASDSALEHMFMHKMPRTKTGLLSPVKMLKESGTKTVVDMLGFHPGEKTTFESDGYVYANKYRDVLPAPLEPEPGELERIEWLFNRIDDESYRTWLKQFYAYVVQHPGVKIHCAPLIWSDTQGNGKTSIVRVIPALLVGKRYSKEVNCAVLNSDFNDVLLNAWHVNLTEFRAGSRGERETISTKVASWIAEDVISIHPKGSAAYSLPNHFFITASSNAEDAASITNQDRKWAIHEMSENHAPALTVTEQNWLYAFLTSKRAAAVLRHYFLNFDTGSFDPNARAPETSARAEMIAASATSDLEALRVAWEERTPPFDRDVVFTKAVQQYIHKNSIARPSMHRVAKLLSRPPYSGTALHFRVGESTYRAIVMRNKARWVGATGPDVLNHIDGTDASVSAEDDLLS